mmetsp:Transcript_49886/g.118948  ORF Transcript_49886/g.118948 Transcript_49886/m.118948 type:complete len:165 (-) Transcript_49886:335-829(-)
MAVDMSKRARRSRKQEDGTPGLPVLSYTSMCKFHLRKKCTRGDQCTFAHDESQLRGKPNLTGTKLCRFFATGQSCRYGDKCTHSHSLQELGQDDADEPRYVHIPDLMSTKLDVPDKLSKDLPLIPPMQRRAHLLALLETLVSQSCRMDLRGIRPIDAQFSMASF